jgi:hypothetical protein
LGTGNRPPLSQVLETPGPGAYNPAGGKPQAYTMNGREKLSMKETPGPGQYTPDDTKVKNKSANYSMGTQKKDLLPCKPLNENPGAGSYHSG